MAHELALALLGHGPGTPGKHCLRPTNKRTFEEIQISSGQVLVHHWGKKYSLDALKMVGETV